MLSVHIRVRRARSRRPSLFHPSNPHRTAIMQTALGIGFLIVWCGLGFLGAAIRAEKGYDSDSCGAVLWGGPLYLLTGVISPTKRY